MERTVCLASTDSDCWLRCGRVIRHSSTQTSIIRPAYSNQAFMPLLEAQNWLTARNYLDLDMP